ncbi:hypothetical protein [Hymenobacter jeollabukensis]|uniref:Gliding motility-associated C-terminal domain-containing protein n=1 Tax=Hymenobacter jeollabukensis TaxID=2025313 RepID=A0A5R8WN51_9BACT|nr:hypothetical protein [Hymenobacter jeollabukensis]TLM91177.1 hypothetical protein FDY95_16415 [Hymenobacter jeollabukensis]
MMLPLLRAFIYPIVAFLVAGPASPHPQPVADGNKIHLLSLDQPPCVSPGSLVTAKLAYRLGPREQSAYGYAVSIKFASTDPGGTFSLGLDGEQAVTQRRDTLTLSYSLTQILGNSHLKRPITCYFYLHRNTSASSSEVITRTPAVVFRECQ